MDLSTDVDFISGALQMLTGERIVARGKDEGASVGSFDLDCLHKRSLQWRDLSPLSDAAMEVPAPTSSSAPLSDEIMELFIRTFTGKKITGMIRKWFIIFSLRKGWGGSFLSPNPKLRPLFWTLWAFLGPFKAFFNHFTN